MSSSESDHLVEQISHERVFSGKVFDVDRDRVRMRNGREVTVEVVRHPKSVVLLPIPEPGHIILIRQYRYPVNRWLWELPAGSVDEGEEPDAAAVRECHEDIEPKVFTLADARDMIRRGEITDMKTIAGLTMI
jgi:ADP-ribose pyrophosphatase